MKIFGCLLISIVAATQMLWAQDSPVAVATRFPDLEKIGYKELSTGLLDVQGTIAESPDGKYMTFVSIPENEADRVSAFDTQSGKRLWSVEGEYCRNIRYTDAGILLYNYSHQQLLDLNTGKDVWAKKPSFWTGFKIPVYTSGSILATCLEGERSPFIGVDLNSGKRVWTTSIKHSYGVAGLYDIDDTHSFIITDLLYKIDWKTGKTESIKINIGDVSGKRFWASGGMVSTRSWQGNTLMPVIASYEVLSGRVSNILEKDGLYYLADQDYIRCFDKYLNVKWQTNLPQRGTRSFIRLQQDTILMINLGMVLEGGVKSVKNGLPYITAFNAVNGNPGFYLPLSTEEHMINMAEIKSDRIVLAYSDSCQVFHFADSSSYSLPMDANAMGKIACIVSDSTFYRFDADTHEFTLLDNDKDYIINDQMEAYLLEAGTDAPVRTVPASLLYGIVDELSEGRKFIMGGINYKDCWILNADNTPYYHFNEPVLRVKVFKHHVIVCLNDGRSLLLDK